MINLRDYGAETWEKWNRPKRTTFVVGLIGVIGLLPFAGNFSFTSILDTPISSYQAVLVYPVGMFVLMALGLNIVVGKSGLLDLGYVAFFAIGAYTAAILGTRTHLNTWEILPIGRPSSTPESMARPIPIGRISQVLRCVLVPKIAAVYAPIAKNAT